MIKVFYDGSCYLCDGEINLYKKYGKKADVEWVDIVHPDFKASDYNLTFDALNKALHAIDHDGNVTTGIDAFVNIWNSMPSPYPKFAAIIQWPIINTLAKIAYVCFAKIRLYLPKKDKYCELKK